MTPWKLVISAALLAGAASAAEPTNVQDPPGDVDVDQPAGVSLSERDTERDSTDTLHGGRTEVIDGERSRGGASHVEVGASESWRNVQPGTEARASFETGTGSGAGAEDAPAATSEGPADTAESTSLGSDLGYGTATDLEAPTPAR